MNIGVCFKFTPEADLQSNWTFKRVVVIFNIDAMEHGLHQNTLIIYFPITFTDQFLRPILSHVFIYANINEHMT